MNALNREEALRAIPSTNELLEHPFLREGTLRFGRNTVLDEVRKTLENLRSLLRAEQGFPVGDKLNTKEDLEDLILSQLANRFDQLGQKSLKRVINGTGIVLHTNLGRAPLSPEAAAAMAALAGGYSNLEYDLEKGTRGSRHDHLEDLLCRLTGGEAAMIVNNNAAAVFLCLNTFASQKEVLVSRGEQVEIGGSFRIPDIITRSGCTMIEVGTTNKTRKEDYIRAISPTTALLLKVHTSNYRITGFTGEVSMKELVRLGREQGIMTMMDLGSGCLVSLSSLGIQEEPTVQECVTAGSDLVTFSGDKLLGGPQAGIIIGSRKAIEKLKANPLSRMIRCDKNTIAAMKETLEYYRSPEDAFLRIPVLAMLCQSEDRLQQKAKSLLALLAEMLGTAVSLRIDEVQEEVGGGSLPGVLLNGLAVSLTTDVLQINELQRRLRNAPIPLICRVLQDRLYIHLRTVEESDFAIIGEALKKALGESS